MWINDAVKHRRQTRRLRARLLSAVVAGLGGLLTVAILSDLFVVALPTPVHAEASAPAFVSLCFQGSGGELLDFAYVGQRCR
jgi:NCAIR mutase (PurE)-related protein